MGWQLFPTGIGWREFNSTPGRGDFTCPNPRCKSAATATPYHHKAGRNWFTVLFVPIIPLNKTGEWVRCTRCKSTYPLHVLGHMSVTAADIAPAVPKPPPAPLPPIAPVVGKSPPMPIEPHVDVPSAPATVPVLRFADGAAFELTGVVVIGRDPAPMNDSASADLRVVSDPTVSKTHLAVGNSGGEVWVLDNQSSNGVFVGWSLAEDTRIPAGRRVMLLPGSVVSIGDSTSFTEGVADRS